MAKATNVTKYDANGVIPIEDGYIKTAEKIWVDTYSFTSAISPGSTLDLAILPKNKKVTSIRLLFPSLSTAASGTGTTISLGVRNNETATGSTLFLNAGEAASGVIDLEANSPTGLGTSMTANSNRIYAQFGRLTTTTTAGTIYSVVKYT